MLAHLPLGSGREFDRIRAIVEALGPAAEGIGDDCAVLPVGGVTLAVSTDVSVEGVHFRRDWLSMEEVGFRATASALSDLAAMGADAAGVLVALVLPRASTNGEVTAVMRGAADAAVQAGTCIVGGDLSSGPAWSVGVTVLGTCGRAVMRAGARAGDGVWVSGALGGARAALTALERGTDPGDARAAFARPPLRLALGRWLARHGATAMLDLSDGLAGDARHLAAASAVRLDLDLDRLPLGPGVAQAAALAGMAPARFAALGGEDYELLVTFPTAFGDADAARCIAETGVPLARIGTVQAGQGVQLLLGGQPLQLPGFDHFA